jgi:hypothetical protein
MDHEPRSHRAALSLACCLAMCASACAAPGDGPYAKWTNGPAKDANTFPLAVWLQSPGNAKRYQAIGINLYIALWQGPTARQLADLKAADMPVICDQNAVGLNDPNNGIIVGWMHGDEPDNAQSLPGGKGYGPPVAPAKIVADYDRMVKTDPTRPVMLNLGQGVAWNGWFGRGERTNHPEDYPLYVPGGDIVSFDIYPVTHDRAEIKGKLEYVARGVDRLCDIAKGERIIWDCIETTHIGNAQVKPTPEQVRSEVWMSIIHGSRGIIYFCHQFAPNFIEAGLLADPAMAAGVKAINAQIQGLASVLNGPTLPDAVKVQSSNAAVPVDTLAKRDAKGTYVFAVAMRGAPTTAAFTVQPPGATRAVVLGEDRTLPVVEGGFKDEFGGYGVHLYRLE